MKISYLLLFPVNKNVSNLGKTKVENIKRAPDFLDIDIDVKRLDWKQYEIDGVSVAQEAFVYDDSVFIFQLTYETNTALSEELSAFKTNINAKIKTKILNEYRPDEKMVEEYTTLLITKIEKIKEFVQKNKFNLARFIRDLEKKISKTDADEILVSEVSYSNDDIAIVDWEGAVLIDNDGDFDSQLELIKIGNYQLMRYRILDQAIERSLNDIRKFVDGKNRRIIGTSFVRTAIKNRLSILLDFDNVDQALLLVGDWYSAKLYKVIMREFYIEDWKNLVRNKIENLETMDTAVRDNLSYSWSRILDFVQIAGWLILLVGYFLLYLKDASIL